MHYFFVGLLTLLHKIYHYAIRRRYYWFWSWWLCERNQMCTIGLKNRSY
jgi:hypothetical protein